MKKTLITLIILFNILNLNAQFSLDAKVNLGLNNVLRISSGTEFIEFSTAFSYNLGVSGAVALWKKGEFVLDVLYFDKRSDVHWLLGMSDNYPVSVKYLSIPSYLRLKAANKFYIDLGYVNNIYLGHKAGEYDVIKANTYTGGILLGLEYQIIPKIKISLNAQTDIMPFSNELIEPVLGENKPYYYNYSFMFSINYRLFYKNKK